MRLLFWWFTVFWVIHVCSFIHVLRNELRYVPSASWKCRPCHRNSHPTGRPWTRQQSGSRESFFLQLCKTCSIKKKKDLKFKASRAIFHKQSPPLCWSITRLLNACYNINIWTLWWTVSWPLDHWWVLCAKQHPRMHSILETFNANNTLLGMFYLNWFELLPLSVMA